MRNIILLGFVIALVYAQGFNGPMICREGQYYCLQSAGCVDEETNKCEEAQEVGRYDNGYDYDRVPGRFIPPTRPGEPCREDEIFCFQTQRCVPTNPECERKFDDDDDDYDGGMQTCPPGTVFCMQRMKCVNEDGTCVKRTQNGGRGGRPYGHHWVNQGNNWDGKEHNWGNGGRQNWQNGRQNGPSIGQNRPTGGQNRPSSGQNSPTSGQNRPTSGQNRPTGTQNRPTGPQISNVADDNLGPLCKGNAQVHCQSVFRPNSILASGKDQLLLLLSIANKNGYNRVALGMDVDVVMKHIAFLGTEAEFNRFLKNLFLQAELLYCLVPWQSGGCVNQRRNTNNPQLSADMITLIKSLCQWSDQFCLQNLDKIYKAKTSKNIENMEMLVQKATFDQLAGGISSQRLLDFDYRGIVDADFKLAMRSRSTSGSQTGGSQNGPSSGTQDGASQNRPNGPGTQNDASQTGDSQNQPSGANLPSADGGTRQQRPSSGGSSGSGTSGSGPGAGGPTGSRTGGQTGGQTGGRTGGQTSGQTGGQTGGQTVDQTGGQTVDQTGGQTRTSGQTGGQTRTSGQTGGQTRTSGSGQTGGQTRTSGSGTSGSGTSGSGTSGSSRTGPIRGKRESPPVRQAMLKLDKLAERPGLLSCTLSVLGNRRTVLEVKSKKPNTPWEKYDQRKYLDGSEQVRVQLSGNEEELTRVNVLMTCSLGYCRNYTKIVQLVVQPVVRHFTPSQTLGRIIAPVLVEQDKSLKLGSLVSRGKVCGKLDLLKRTLGNQCYATFNKQCNALKKMTVYMERSRWIENVDAQTDNIERQARSTWRKLIQGGGAVFAASTELRITPKKGWTGYAPYKVYGVKDVKQCRKLLSPPATIDARTKKNATRLNCLVDPVTMHFLVKDKRDKPQAKGKSVSEGSCLKPAPYDLANYKGESVKEIVERLYTSVDGKSLSLCILSQNVPENKGQFEVKMNAQSEWEPLSTKQVDNTLAQKLHPVVLANLYNNAAGCKKGKKAQCDRMTKILKAKAKLLAEELTPFCLPDEAWIQFRYPQDSQKAVPIKSMADQFKIIFTATDRESIAGLKLNISRTIHLMAGHGTEKESETAFSSDLCIGSQSRYGCNGGLNSQEECRVCTAASGGNCQQTSPITFKLPTDVCGKEYDPRKNEKPCTMCFCTCDSPDVQFEWVQCEGSRTCLPKSSNKKCPAKRSNDTCDGIFNQCGYCVLGTTRRKMTYGIHCSQCMDDPQATDLCGCNEVLDACGKCRTIDDPSRDQGCVAVSASTQLLSTGSPPSKQIIILDSIFGEVSSLKIVGPKNLEIDADVSQGVSMDTTTGTFKYPFSIANLNLDTVTCLVKLQFKLGRETTVGRLTFFSKAATSKQHRADQVATEGKPLRLQWALDVPSSLQAWRLRKNWTVAYDCSAQTQNNRCPFGGKMKMFGATPRQEGQCYCLIGYRYIRYRGRGNVQMNLATMKLEIVTGMTATFRIMYAEPTTVQEITDAPAVNLKVEPDTPIIRKLVVWRTACALMIVFNRAVALQNKDECQRSKNLDKSAKIACTAKIFKDFSKLGLDAQTYISRSVVRVQLGSSASVGLETELAIKADTLKARGDAEGASGFVSGSVKVAKKHLQNVILRVRISGRKEIGKSDSLALNARAIGAAGCGTKPKFMWSVASIKCPSTVADTTIQALRDAVKAIDTDRLRLDSDEVPSGCSFNFTVKVENKLLVLVAAASQVVEKVDEEILGVDITGPRRSTPSEGLDLEVKVDRKGLAGTLVYECDIAPLHCKEVYECKGPYIQVDGDRCDFRAMETYTVTSTVTLYEDNGNVQKKVSWVKVKMGLEDLRIDHLYESKVEVTNGFTAVVQVTDPNNRPSEIISQWSIKEITVDTDGNEMELPLQVVKDGSLVFLQDKCSLTAEVQNKNLLYNCPLGKDDLIVGKKYKICLKTNNKTSCKIVDAIDKEPPAVRLSVQLESGYLKAHCVMCYAGRLIGTLTIEGGDASTENTDGADGVLISKEVSKSADQLCMSSLIIWPNVTEGATYDMRCTAEVNQTVEEELANPLGEAKIVSRDSQIEIPYSPKVTVCDVSCSDCKALKSEKVNIAVADDFENLVYSVQAVCQKNGKEEIVELSKDSFGNIDIEVMFPVSLVGLACKVRCNVQKRQVSGSLDSSGVNILSNQEDLTTAVLKAVVEDESMSLPAVAQSAALIQNAADQTAVQETIMAKMVSDVASVQDLPAKAEAVLRENNAVMEILANSGLKVDDDIRNSFADATASATAPFQNVDSTEASKRRRKRAAPTTIQATGPIMTAGEAENILTGWHNSILNITDDNIPKSLAQKFVADFESAISPGLCRGANQNASAIKVMSQLVAMNTQWPSFVKIADKCLNVSCNNCSDSQQPCYRCPHNQTASLALNKTIETTYTQWNCKTGYQCSGACVVSAQIKRDIVSASSNYTVAKSTRWSDIVSVFLINPETKALVNVTLTGSSKRIAMKIPVMPDSNNYIPECRQWVNQTWNKESCQTSNVVMMKGMKHVICYCMRATYTAVFRGPVKEVKVTNNTSGTASGPAPAAPAVADTPQAPTTVNPFLENVTPAPTTTTTVSSGGNDNQNSGNSNSDSSNSAGSNVQPNQPSNQPSSSGTTANVQFKLTNDYDTIVGSDKTAFENALKPQLATQMKVSADNINGVSVSPGSIVIAFTVTGSNATALNSSLQNLQNQVSSGNLVITSPNGTVLTVNQGSYTVISINPVTTTTTTAAPAKKEDNGNEQKLGIIIGAAVGGGLLIILVVVLAVICCKKPPKKIDPTTDSPRGYENQSYAAPPARNPNAPMNQELYCPKEKNAPPNPIPEQQDLGKPAGRLTPLPRGQVAARPGTPGTNSMTDLG